MASPKIVITGAESTGKTTLSRQLAHHYQTICISELAKSDPDKLNQGYNIQEMEAIAKKQIDIEANIIENNRPIFFDTWLIITKVWFDTTIGNHPTWIDDAIHNSNIKLFLICDIDLPWIYDPMNENGGKKRILLQKTYIEEIEKLGFPYKIINGIGDARTQKAISAIESLM